MLRRQTGDMKDNDHCSTCIYQVIMLYNLNLYNVICHLYLNKTEKKKERKMMINPDVVKTSLSEEVAFQPKAET